MRRVTAVATVFAALTASLGAGDARGEEAAGTIEGVVEIGEHSMPDAGRTVTLRRDGAEPRTTTTDAWGRYRLDGVAPGVTWSVEAGGEGLATDRVPGIELIPGERRDAGTLFLGTPRKLDVQVFDERGAPLGGARVDLFREPIGTMGYFTERARREPPSPFATATTDTEGRARFELTRGPLWTVAAQAPGRGRVAEALTWRSRRAASVRIQLHPEATITGVVRDVSGAASACAWILARRYVESEGWCGTCDPPPESSALFQRFDADAQGRFALSGLPLGRIELIAGAQGAGGSQVATVMTPDVRDLDLTLAGRARIEGRVVESGTGAPIAGVVVGVSGEEYLSRHLLSTATLAVSGADGRFALDCEADAWFLRVLPPKEWTASYPWRLAAGPAIAVGAVVRPELTLVRSAVVEGRAHDGSGPVGAAEVDLVVLSARLQDHPVQRRSTRTAADGRFRIEGVVPGLVALRAARAGEDDYRADDVWLGSLRTADGRARGAFTVAAGEVASRDLAVGPFSGGSDRKHAPDHDAPEPAPRGTGLVRVHGRISTADGVPLLDAAFAVGDREPRGGLAEPVQPDGTYEYEIERASSVTVRARDARHAMTEVRAPVKWDATDVRVDLVLTALPVVRGRVVAAGVPVAGAWIARRGCIVASAGADGSFWLRTALDPETYVVGAPGFAERPLSDSVVDGDGVLRVELEQPHAIAGVVVDREGKPAAGLVVTLLVDDEDRPPQRLTDADGRFRFDGLPRCAWPLRVEAPLGSDPRLAAVRTEPVEAGAPETRIVVGPAKRIAGRVVGPDGRPVTAGRVTCGPGVEDEDPVVRLGDDGRFAFEDLGASPEYRVDVIPDRDDALCPAKRFVEPTDEEVVFELVRSTEISGRVLTAAGRPIPRTQILAERTSPRAEDEPEWPWGLDDYTDEKDGSFRIVVPPGATFRLSIGPMSRSRSIGILAGADAIAAGSTGLKLALADGPSLRGVVVDELDLPVEKAEAEIWYGFGQVWRARSDANGSFRLHGLPEGKGSLTIQSDGRFPFWLDGAGASDLPLRVVLRKGLSIRGRALDAKGLPLRDCEVRATSVRYPRVDLWRSRIDESGRFEVKGLDEGAWRLEAIVTRGMSIDRCDFLGNAEAGARDVELRLSE